MSKKMKSRIVICRSNPVEPDSRVEKIANSLMLHGYAVTIVAWDRNDQYFIRKDRKKLADVEVNRVSFGAKAEYGAGMKSLPAFISFQLRLFFWLIVNAGNYDIGHFCDFDTALIGSLTAKILKKKYVFDIFDYLSTDAEGFFRRFIKRLENSVINRASATIICSEQRKQQIRGTHPKKLVVIHNTPADNIIHLKHNSEKKSADIIKIVYVGILQDYRLLKEMIKVIPEYSYVEFHIAGFGKYEEYIRNAASKSGNIYYYGRISYDRTLELENDCDIMTAIYDPKIGNHRYAAPNKFYEALYLGKPLIMVKDTGMSDVVQKSDLGVLIEYSEDGFRDGLDKLIARRSEWKSMAERMQNIYEKNFSWNEMSRRLKKLYLELENE